MTGVLLLSVKVPVTVRVGLASPPLLLKVTLLRVWLTEAAKVRLARPFIVRSVDAAMALLVLRLTVVPAPCSPPWMVSPPAGMTTTEPSVTVGLIFSVPRLTTVPPP